MKIRFDDEDTRKALEEYLNARMVGEVKVAQIRKCSDGGAAGGSVEIEANIEITEVEE